MRRDEHGRIRLHAEWFRSLTLDEKFSALAVINRLELQHDPGLLDREIPNPVPENMMVLSLDPLTDRPPGDPRIHVANRR